MHTLLLLWPRRCHCTRQPLVYGCSPHSPVLRPACGLLRYSVSCSSLQSSLIMSIHLFFCLLLFLVPCTYPLHAIFGYRSFFIRFRCPKYRSRLFRILSIIPILIFSLLDIFSFLILSLLVTPSIFRRHAISNTLSFCFCFSFIVHVSALYSRVLNTSTSYMRVFVALLSSLEFHTFPSACQVPLANP